MKCVVHTEIILTSESTLSPNDVQQHVQGELQSAGSIHPGRTLAGSSFSSDIIKNNVACVKFCDVSELSYHHKLEPESSKKLACEKISFNFHVYQLEEDEIEAEEINIGGDSNERVAAANYCLLPHSSFNDIWEHLIFDTSIKEQLLEYATTSTIFSERKVDTNVITWNRVILLYGPPGTGKTSLCKGLAQKLSIRMKKYYNVAEFIEINSHSLFSKYFSESGKLVMEMFSKIKEHLELNNSLVCVLIDEIESLTHARSSCMNGAEPSDSIRVVNAILTQIDQIRKYPNVIILTTSNLKSAIDTAFVDRADLQMYVGPPSWRAIYQIFSSCLEELVRVAIIKSENTISFLPVDCISDDVEQNDLSRKLLDVAKSSEGLSGRILRKLPFLAYSHFSKSESQSVNNYIDALQQAVDQHRSCKEDTFNAHQN